VLTNHYSTSASTVVLSVDPPESNVTIGQEFDVNILVKAGSQQVDGVSAYLDFDPTYLEVVEMTPGDQLNLTLDNSFDNGAGTINFAAGKLTSPFPSGDFDLVTITLKAKAETPEAGTPLSFVLNPPRRTDATFGGASVLDHTEDGIIIIIGKSELQFSSAAYTTTENGEQATITVTRTINSDGAVSVDYATSDDTATAPDDYTQTSGTLNWADGDTTDRHIQVGINDDSLQENDETFIVSLDNPTGGAQLGEPDTAAVTITDNDTTKAVILSVEPPESNVSIGQEFDINILVKAGTQQVDGVSAYLDFETTYLEVVSMTTGGHLDVILEDSFDNGAGYINFAAEKTTSPFPSGDFDLVTITLKAKAETPEAGTPLSFVLNPPRRTDATFGGASVLDHAEDGSIIIITDEKSELQFSSAAYTTTENGGQATITVTRTINSDGAVSVDYATSDDTATAPDDYTQTSGTLNWADGDTTDRHIQVGINDDSLQENDETFIVSLDNPTGGAQLGEPDTAAVTITDNDTTKAVILSVEPPESNVSIGQEFDINILVKAGTQQVDGVSAYLDFETTYLEVVSMTTGGHLDVILEDSFDNGAGYINFAAEKTTSPFPSGDFDLVTITLKAKAETPEAGTPLSFVLNPPRRTDATFSGASVFDHAEDGSIIITNAFNCKQVAGISKKKCQALIALYDSTDGDNWVNNTGWKVTNRPCKWYGVSCKGGFVEKIELASNNLKGSISPKFFKLKDLENLVLFNNDLNGLNFNNLRKLKNLRMLLVNNCNLTGKLPNSLMRLKKLRVLSLHNNCLKIKVSKKLKKWLDKLNPGWDETQTSCLY
jgi:ABC-type lipoprotein release transport system permease subunit